MVPKPRRTTSFPVFFPGQKPLRQVGAFYAPCSIFTMEWEPAPTPVRYDEKEPVMKMHSILIALLIPSLMPCQHSQAQTFDMELTMTGVMARKVVEAPFDYAEDISMLLWVPAYVMKDASGVLHRTFELKDFTPDFYNNLDRNTGSAEQPFFLYPIGDKNKWLEMLQYIPGPNPDARLELVKDQMVVPSPGYTFRKRNITLEQLASLELLVGGAMNDWEIYGLYPYKACTLCQFTSSDKNMAFRRLRLIDQYDQYANMAAGSSKFLTYGSDQTLQLDYFERDANSSHVVVYMKVKVTRH